MARTTEMVLVILGVFATSARADKKPCVCAPPPSRAPAAGDAEAVATRWLRAVKAGESASAAKLMTATARVATAPCEIHETASRAEVIRAVPTWRYCLEFRPAHWTTTTTDDDWREVTTRVDGESFGTLTVRVGRDLQIRAVAIHWSQGGI